MQDRFNALESKGLLSENRTARTRDLDREDTFRSYERVYGVIFDEQNRCVPTGGNVGHSPLRERFVVPLGGRLTRRLNHIRCSIPLMARPDDAQVSAIRSGVAMLSDCRHCLAGTLDRREHALSGTNMSWEMNG